MRSVAFTAPVLNTIPKSRYARSDLLRWAQRYQLPYNPGDMKKTDSEACSRAVLAAGSAGQAGAATEALFRACWGEGRTLASVADVLTVLAAAGIDTQSFAELIDDPTTVAALDSNTQEAAARGVFGSPTMLIGEAMFFGNDRLDFVREHLAQLGDKA